nr:unnamed protein product [Callosobruchus analis]
MTYAIYSSEWVDGDLSYKKLINIYLALTKKPLAIRLGGGITIATLPVFVKVKLPLFLKMSKNFILK